MNVEVDADTTWFLADLDLAARAGGAVTLAASQLWDTLKKLATMTERAETAERSVQSWADSWNKQRQWANEAVELVSKHEQRITVLEDALRDRSKLLHRLNHTSNKNIPPWDECVSGFCLDDRLLLAKPESEKQKEI